MMGSVVSRASEAEAVTDCVSSAIHHSTAKFAKPSPCMDMAWPVNIHRKSRPSPGLACGAAAPRTGKLASCSTVCHSFVKNRSRWRATARARAASTV